jgi:outer membrane protein insertion porin family
MSYCVSAKKYCFFRHLLSCTIATFIFLSPGFAAAESDPPERVKVFGLYSLSEEELLYLLDLDPEKELTAARVKTGIKRAFLKGIFEDISVEITEDDAPQIIVRVRERTFIDDISVEGSSALSKKTIRKMFRVKKGQFLYCNLLQKAEEDLRTQLAVHGYQKATVRSTIEHLKEPYRINLLLSVHTGEPEIIREITLSGVDRELRDDMELSEGDVYNQTLLKKDIAEIKSSLKKDGYYRPVIESYTFREGVLTISVHPGKRLKIALEGNDKVSSKALLKQVPFFDTEDFNEDIIEETVQRLLSVYHAEGYPFAQIAPVATEDDKNWIHLTFFVFEGPPVWVGTISLMGTTLQGKSLKEVISLKEGKKYNPDFLETDRSLLLDFYHALGYLGSVVEEFRTDYSGDTQTMDIHIVIHEGPQTTIGRIDVTGMNTVPEKEIRKALSIHSGDAYNEVDISDARYRLIELYSKKGYPESDISLTRLFEGKKTHITFTIDEGPRVLFGKAIVTGNNLTKYRVIRRELLQREGNPYNYSLVTKQKQRLYKLGIFSDVDSEIIDRGNQIRDVLIQIREGNAGAVEFGVGYGDYERLRGFFDIGYRNLWGLNRQASLRFEMSTLEKRGILQYYEPWFLDMNLPFRAFLLGEDKRVINIDSRDTRYELERYTATAGIEKKFTNNIKTEFYYELSHVDTYNVQPDVVLSKEDTGTLLISGIRPGLIYDTRDNPFYPTKGILTGLSLKVTTPLLFSETDFMKLTFYYNMYHALSKRIVLATSFRGGLAKGYNDTTDLVEGQLSGAMNRTRWALRDQTGIPQGGTPSSWKILK